MTNDPINHDSSHPERTSDLSGLELSPASLLRIAADGETDLLSDAQRDELNELLRQPENQAYVGHERSLRSATQRAMSAQLSSHPTPAGLRDRVLANLSQASDAEVAFAQAEPASEHVAERMASVTRSQSFWARAGATLAVAAALAIGSVMIFTGPGQQAAEPGSTAQAGLLSRVVTFVSKEHGRCLIDESVATSKQTVVDAEGLPELVKNVMGQDLSLDRLLFSESVSADFMRGGRCGVPKNGGSVHLSFNAQHDGEPMPVSLFIQRDLGELALEPGKTYKGGSACETVPAPDAAAVYFWSENGLIYFLVTEGPTGCTKLLEDRAAPEEYIELEA